MFCVILKLESCNDFLDAGGQAGNDYFDGPSVPENIVVDITK